MICGKCKQEGHTTRDCNQVISREFVAQQRGIPGATPFFPVQASDDNANVGALMAQGLPAPQPSMPSVTPNPWDAQVTTAGAAIPPVQSPVPAPPRQPQWGFDGAPVPGKQPDTSNNNGYNGW
jgi:hypothetical protein